MRKCPCRSGRRYAKCCERFHGGVAAPTPEKLMRSRYAAYAMGLVDYVMATTHPGGQHWQPDRDSWAAGIQSFCEGTRFRALTIVDAGEDGQHGWVEFVARLEQGGRDASFRERSTFERVEGRWLYHSGVPETGSDR